MEIQEWIDAYADALIKDGSSESSARLLAKSTAAAHKRIKGEDTKKWPSPSMVRPIFNTSDEQKKNDIHKNDAI